ncbi:MAG: Rrf2 family transcriptional regulator [Elusimicrobia bacterium]|nr:Rrf2 family transcriptional regulator [Elusimicrobiota bacterium]
MSGCLNLTKAGEYAISALSRLALEAERQPEKTLSVRGLARAQNIPSAFLAKIVAALARSGLVRSRRGPTGGIRLARAADRITLLSIVEACEGQYMRDLCVFYPGRRCDGPDCEVYCPLRRGEEELRLSLAGMTLAQMADSLKGHPDLRASNALEEKNGDGGNG